MSRAIAVVIASIAVLTAAGVTSSAAQEAHGAPYAMADDGFGRRPQQTTLDDGFGWGTPKNPGGTLLDDGFGWGAPKSPGGTLRAG